MGALACLRPKAYVRMIGEYVLEVIKSERASDQMRLAAQAEYFREARFSRLFRAALFIACVTAAAIYKWG